MSPSPSLRRRRSHASRLLVLAMVIASMIPVTAVVERTGAAPSGWTVLTQTPTTVAELRPPRASIVVDADSGEIWSAHNSHEPVLVASTIKLFTALVVDRRLGPNDLVPVSAHAASMPARKMNLLAGEQWKVRDLQRTMLIASANDSAVALAERVGGGTTAGYGQVFAEEATRLGLRDDPKIVDASGLDDEFSVDGGNLISAYDLAIVSRAYLEVPELARIVRVPEYRFVGGDDEPHVVTNHNRFLAQYPGAIGLKTGATKRSGHSLVAAATRNDRTLIAVVIDSPNPSQQAAALLDRAFLLQLADRQPMSQLAAGPTTTTTTTTTTAAVPTDAPTDRENGEAAAGADGVTTASSGGSGSGSDATTRWAAVACGAAALVLVSSVVHRRRISRPAARRR